MRTQLKTTFDEIISPENLLEAWGEFVKGKRGKIDVQEFNRHLMDNLMQLHSDLTDGNYQHGPYQAFTISDPKRRDIHKASVRDRVLHHAIYKQLYPFFDHTFVSDSFSCRLEKGTHEAMRRFRYMANRASKNNTRTCWVIKCDIRKFFASIDQGILLYILSTYILDQKILGLLKQIVTSFQSTGLGKGLPLGNLTSQLLVNVYMNEFDQYVKHRLRAKYYIRYADDFVLMAGNKELLERAVIPVSRFLEQCLQLSLHPDKISIETSASGVDFLGWVHFPKHQVLRTVTKRRMQKRIQQNPEPETLASYLGLISHGDTEQLRQEALNTYAISRAQVA